MELLRCKNCSGSDLKPFPGHPNLVKCSFCGTTYLLDSHGNLQKEKQENFSLSKNHLIWISGYVIVLVVLVSLFLLVASKPSNPIEKKISQPIIPNISVTKPANIEEENPDDYKGEIVKINHFKATEDTVYYIAIYKNTGNKLLSKPLIQINFYDENDNPIDTEIGYGYKDTLQPADQTGVVVLSKRKNQLARSEILHFPQKPTYVPEEVNLKVSNIKLMKGKFFKYELIGEIENVDAIDAEFVSANAILLDEKDMPISMQSTYISEKILKPGKKSLFKIGFSIISGTPQSYFLETSSRAIK
jgi:hypothetical protein